MVSRLHEREGELEIIVAALEAARAGRGAAVAVHLLRSEPRGDEDVAATLAEAGRRALASGAPARRPPR